MRQLFFVSVKQAAQWVHCKWVILLFVFHSYIQPIGDVQSVTSPAMYIQHTKSIRSSSIQVDYSTTDILLSFPESPIMSTYAPWIGLPGWKRFCGVWL